jgi:hypothetical protein
MVVKMSMFSGCDALNMDTVHFLEILESTYKSTQCHDMTTVTIVATL